MAANYKDDQKWSDSKKMEREDSLRTLDCLRGRLLAERHASRLAKQDAQFLGDKLVELENKLREETQLRQKAEKKLKFLMKKLQSLNISPALQGLELMSTSSSSSEIFGFSCSSSSTSSASSDPQHSPSKSHLAHQDLKESASASVSSTQHSSHSDPNLQEFQDASKADSQSCSKSEAPAEKDECNNEENIADNSLALVRVSVAATTNTSTATEMILVNKSVSEVLDALRHAREKIQSSIERRRHKNMIRVGPT